MLHWSKRGNAVYLLWIKYVMSDQLYIKGKTIMIYYFLWHKRWFKSYDISTGNER